MRGRTDEKERIHMSERRFPAFSLSDVETGVCMLIHCVCVCCPSQKFKVSEVLYFLQTRPIILGLVSFCVIPTQFGILSPITSFSNSVLSLSY